MFARWIFPAPNAEPSMHDSHVELRSSVRSRAQVVVALLVYGFGVFVAPVLHRLHHLEHGADHEHTALGTIYFAADAREVVVDETSEAAHHAALDQELIDLKLGEVAFAGTLSVDCAYAEYTLAACDSAATANHPRTFGDDLLAREHHHRAPQEDPLHGLGSLEHLAGFILSSPTFVLPPPCQTLTLLATPTLVSRQGEHVAVAPPIRGPPSAA
jgi:hypothetical protein